MNEPTTDGNDIREQRVLELTTGFALGGLSDGELRELYDFLREPGDAGQQAGKAAWEALSVCVDLRAQMGTSFQDSLYLQLSESGETGTATFVNKVRNRLGHSRPRLQPVETPAFARHRAWLRPLIAVVAIIVAVLIIVPWWAPRREAAMATVTAVIGSVARDGASLALGAEVDRQQILVAPSAQVTLAWIDGSTAVIAGPAAVVAGGKGMSLLSGRAWIRTHASFTIGLPDRAEAVTIPAECAVAVEIRDNRSSLALVSGRIEGGRLRLLPDEVVDLGQSDQAYPWQHLELANGLSATTGATQARWDLRGTVVFREPNSAIVLRIQLADDHVAECFISPVSAALRLDGRELQRLALGGAPLAEREVQLQAQGSLLAVVLGGQKMEVTLPAGALQVSWDGEGGELRQAVFSTGPARKPPFPADGW